MTTVGTTSAITPEDFAYLSDLVMREAAIVLERGKEYLAVNRLQPLARDTGHGDITTFIAALRKDHSGTLKNKVVDAMTTNETLWFRDVHPFDTLHDSVVPAIMNARGTTRQLDIWCAAASTGQEPYTLAMVLAESFPALRGWRVRIVATDISDSALARARAGRYTQMEMGRGLPAKYLVKYFSRSGTEFEISPEIKKMVEFKNMNLASPGWTLFGAFDLVFIRNVLIYFNQQTKTQILHKAEKLLRPDGLLFLGATESVMGIETTLQREQRGKTTLFRPGSHAPATPAGVAGPRR